MFGVNTGPGSMGSCQVMINKEAVEFAVFIAGSVHRLMKVESAHFTIKGCGWRNNNPGQ